MFGSNSAQFWGDTSKFAAMQSAKDSPFAMYQPVLKSATHESWDSDLETASAQAVRSRFGIAWKMYSLRATKMPQNCVLCCVGTLQDSAGVCIDHLLEVNIPHQQFRRHRDVKICLICQTNPFYLSQTSGKLNFKGRHGKVGLPKTRHVDVSKICAPPRVTVGLGNWVFKIEGETPSCTAHEKPRSPACLPNFLDEISVSQHPHILEICHR